MKIYKFRQLMSESDYCRLKSIIETGHFWCSNFWELNDPMEGVFSSSYINIINKRFDEKSKYKICSFSGKVGFKHPTMWGYYAGGFKGVAIEIEAGIIKSSQCTTRGGVKKISYKDELPGNDDIEKILLNKGKAWKHENEFRFLIKSETNYRRMGKISAIYFGDPYGNAVNEDDVTGQGESFKQYKIFKKKIIKIAENKEIPSYHVDVKEGVVGISKKKII